MSRTFVTSDGVSADALQKNKKFLLDNYILKNKTIPIELFGDNTTIAIGEAITFLTNNGGGAVHIPAQGSTFDLEIRVFKDRSGTFNTQYIYNYDRYPTVESRPYSGGDWKVGDTIINTQPTVDKCLGWVCSANGTPGTWTPFGWCKTWFSEIEQVDSLPDPSILQANRQLVYGGKVCYCMLVNGEYKWVYPVDGADGKSAYAYAVDGGYTGTETEFAKKLALASGALIVTITGSNGILSADKTFLEIKDAILAGTTVLVDYYGIYLPLIAVTAEALTFGTIQCVNDDYGTRISTEIINITSNGEVNDISTDVDALPNPNAITFKGAVTGRYDGSAPMTVEIPSGGSGVPKPLTFTGAVTGIYDGSEALTVEIPSGGSGVPKPLTYDYMPDGYPSKSGQTATLIEEKEFTFSTDGTVAVYFTDLPSTFNIVEGKTYTVNWDGTEYKCVGAVFDSRHVLGNLSILGMGNDTGEPFLCAPDEGKLGTLDTSPTHTVSITELETIIPMAEKFIPKMNVSTFTNDAGYLTLNTLPKYEGVVE